MPLQRRTPLRRSGFMHGSWPKGLRRTRLRPCSFRQKRRLTEYYRLRKEFLARPDQKICPVAFRLRGILIQTTDIHHKRGRIGPLLLDQNHWLAVSRWGHMWIHDHPAEARAYGWLG